MLSVCFVFNTKCINATGFEDFLRLRSKSATLNEGGFVLNTMQLDIFKEIKLAKSREAYKKLTNEQRLKNRERCKKRYKEKSKSHNERRRLRESKLHPLLVSKGVKIIRGIVIRCLVCNKEKYVAPCHIKNKTKFCSQKCHIDYQKATSHKLKCLICNKVFHCAFSQYKQRNRKTCSVQCKYKYITQRAEQKRLNNPESLRNIDKSIRHSKRMVDWRKAVFERDNYICQKCKVRSKKGIKVILEAHHIKQYALYPELRFEINNGQTLCKKCHKTIKHFTKRRTGETI